VARANLDLYSLDRGILSRAQNNQIIQRQQGLVNSSGIPKSQTFFVRPSFSVFAAGGNQSTSASTPQTFTSNFTNQATSQPTIFTSTTTTTTTTTDGTQDLTSAFDSGFTSTLESTTTTTTRAVGGGGVNDFNAYGDSREEPNRLALVQDTLPHVLLVPNTGYENYGGTLTGVIGADRDGNPVRFTRFEPQDTNIYLWGRELAPGRFVVGGGPNGSNCIETQDNTGGFILTQYTGLTFAIVDQNEYDTLYNGLNYRVLVVGPQLDPGESFSTVDEALTKLWINNQIVVPTSEYKLGDIETHTFEYYLRFGSDDFSDYNPEVTETITVFSLALRRFIQVTVSGFDRRRFDMDITFAGLWLSIDCRPTGSGVSSNFRIIGRQYEVAEDTDIVAPWLENVTSDFIDYFFASGEVLLPGRAWFHFATVRNFDGSYSLFFDGNLICKNIQPKESWDEVYGQDVITGDVLMGITSLTNSTVPGYNHPAVHGIRFTPEALYSDTFTPPPSITDFA
jgi:hypothetical protein